MKYARSNHSADHRCGTQFATITLAAIVSLGGCAHAPPPAAIGPAPPAIVDWAGRHPIASIELGDWIRLHPAAATPLLTWEAREPQRAKQLVTWAILNPDLTTEMFAVLHPEWPELASLLAEHRAAADALLLWCRNHPRGSERLVDLPDALAWTGEHLDASLWHLSRPLP